MHIVILGAPGAGKGTQAKLISEKYNIPSISTGDLLRRVVAEKKYPIAFEIEARIDKGLLVGNDLILAVLKNRLQQDDCKGGFILDGFPRSLEQAELMEQLFNNKTCINFIINIAVDTETLVKRLSGRFSCKNCNTTYNKFFLKPKEEGVCDNCGGKDFIHRSDDEESVIRNRMAVYESETIPLLSYYENNSFENWHLKSFDGDKDVTEIFSEICYYLDNIICKQ